jgi:phosphoglycolate phosphatase-like HAD superfamily hydrolase
MKLAIFDIDGTLTNTNLVDGACFVQAFADVYDITDIETDWSKYPHTTDPAIALQIFQQRWGRQPTDEEMNALKERFEALLNQQRSAEPGLFAEIPGASSMIDRLQNASPGWAVGIATGCWAASATLKLMTANIRVDSMKVASAEDNLSREKIVEASFQKALAYYQQPSFERIVSIGDGVWDVRTARNLGFAFLGIGSGEHADLLRKTGARRVIPNYEDFDEVVRNLEDAPVPEAEEKS